jgi:RNA recognition motif-containing protein
MENFMKKIFIGNLPWKATEDTLRDLFAAFGEVVSVRIVKDPYTDRSRGFGFVEMKNPAEADKAIEELNDKPFLERNLRVSAAQEREGGGGGREGGRGGDRREGGGGGGMRRDSRPPRGGGFGDQQRPSRSYSRDSYGE